MYDVDCANDYIDAEGTPAFQPYGLPHLTRLVLRRRDLQLRSHMAASMRVGLTASRLRQVIQVLADHGDADAAKRARAALDTHLAGAAGRS